jgi:flagellar motor switch protein FliM
MGVKLGLTSREKRRLPVFENKLLRKILRTKWEEVTEAWRRVHKGIFKVYVP